MTPDSTETKIVTAAVECVEEFGLKGATNRRIAEKAGVNLAAINYYFRSKDNLIDKVMEVTLNNAFDWVDIQKLPGSTAKERCIAVFDDLIRGGTQYPGITRAHFYDLITGGNYDSLIVKKYSEFISRLCVDLANRGASKPKEQLEMACAQIASACFMAVLAPQLSQTSFNINLQNPETRLLFVTTLVEALL